MFARIDSRPAGNRRSNSWKIFSAVVVSSVLLLTTMNGTARAATGPRCYVMASASGANNGNSWTDAYTDLQSALTNSVCSEVWVAAGLYRPTTGSDVSISFIIAPGVAVYGGFAGTESLLSERNPAANITILSGDIGGDDTNLDGNHIDETTVNIVGFNSRHVVKMDGTSTLVTSSTVLDGLTITGGDAIIGNSGGGLNCNGSGSGHQCSPTLANLTFSGNAGDSGGGIYDNGNAGASSPSLTNVHFSGNDVVGSGGAMFNDGTSGNSSPTLTDVSFSGNTAGDNGGAMFNLGDGGTSSPTLTNVSFNDNTASQLGGAMYNYGEHLGSSSPTLTDVSFTSNFASGNGGALYNDGESSGNSSPVLTRVTFNGNNGGGNAGAMYDDGSSTGTSNPTLTDVTFASNSAVSGYGGAIYNNGSSGGHSSPVLSRVTFSGNSANQGGAMFDDAFAAGVSNPALTDVTFFGNTAIYGGGLYSIASSGQSNPSLLNVTFNGNHANVGGGGMYNDVNSNPSLINVILWGDTATFSPEIKNFSSTPLIQFSDIQGSGGSGGSWDSSLGTDGGANLDSDPRLAAIATDPGSLVPTMDLQPGSAAADTGDDEVCPPLDARGISRPLGAHCDMGAVEFQGDHITVGVHGATEGTYNIPHTWAQEHGYPGVNNGPAQVTNTDGEGVVSSIRVIFGGNSYSEMMGYPNASTTDFWFPWYNNVAFDSQFRVSNLGGSSTTITVSLGGSTIDSFSLGAGAAVRKNFPGQNSGPMHVSSSGGMPILSTIRVLFGGSSYSEMMGYPDASTFNFFFPWYNDVAYDSQFRVSNLGSIPTTITVYLAGAPIDTFSLAGGAAIRKNYPGQNNGPMQVNSSTTPILSTIRVLYAGISYSEMMGYPNASTPDFWFPWYDNVGAGTQFRVSNLGGSPTTITVSLGGTAIDSFLLAANSAVRKSYAGKNTGGFHVTSSVTPILATERILYGANSFYELTGSPTYLMTSTQYFPWYNDSAFDSQMRIAVP